jgi:hypothetical protein
MTTQMIPVPRSSCTLYELEDNLQALVNSIDLAQEPASREMILEEIGQAVRKTREKRDAVVVFLRHCEVQEEFADSEIARLQKRKAFIARVREELEQRVIEVVEQFAVPDRRGVKLLEGNCSSVRIQKNPDSVVVFDTNLLPPAFKHAILTMPAYVWEGLLQCLDAEERKEFEKRVERIEFRPDKRAIGTELKNGTAILGADLSFGDWRLVIS